MAVIGWFGYSGGVEITPTIQTGITFAVNIIPAAIFLIGIIPIALYRLNESDMPEIRQRLAERNEQREKDRAARLNQGGESIPVFGASAED